MSVLIESEPPLDCPEMFPDTDGRHFLGTFFGRGVEVLEQRTKLDLSPLKYCSLFVDDADAEVMGEEWVEQAKRGNELAWHSPDAFIVCLEKLAAQLRDWDKKLPAAICRTINPTGSNYHAYYRSKHFYSDVCGCLAAMRSLKQQGAVRVRFFAF